ncbi:MAG: PLDc N-terminal domain-containing protein [Dehalococcoidales bacterium]|nr:PLDc N-terminal domain-containing protein [Dehalococcoidales bacterium]
MDGMETFIDILPFLIPLAVIEFGLMIFALNDLIKRKVVKGGKKLPWGIVIVVFSIIGPIFYLLVGREEY